MTFYEAFNSPFQAFCLLAFALLFAFGANYPSWRLARRKGRRGSMFRWVFLDFGEFDRTEWIIFSASLILAATFAGAALCDAHANKVEIESNASSALGKV